MVAKTSLSATKAQPIQINGLAVAKLGCKMTAWFHPLA
jgi:hypothetical protein